MCGILGIFCTDKTAEFGSRINHALTAMKRRGPDDSGSQKLELPTGTVILGHTRLSIIDLSTGGHQPMHTADNRFSIVFNGEIYNYRELRELLKQEGYKFSSESDTEVLLYAWAKWGVDCIRRLVGMFSFVVLDRNLGTMTFVRDGFGIKPLFISKSNSSVFFASELPALLILRGEKAELNHQRAYDYLIHGDYDTRETSFISGVTQLAPGFIQVLDTQSGIMGEPKRWWSPSVIQTSTLSFGDAAERLRELFLQNIRYHLRSDVPLGTALSGGLDSSAVVCAMRHLEPDAPIHTFSFIAKGSPVSEEAWIKLVNEHVGAIPHSVLVEPTELACDLDDMISAQGEPFGSTSIYAQYRVFKLARESGVTVTLDGQGADEILAGYRGYPGKRVRSLIEQGKLSKVIPFLKEWSKWPDRTLALGIKASIAEFSNEKLYQIFRSWHGGETHPNWLNISFLQEKGVKLEYPRFQALSSPRGRHLMAELAHSATRNGLPGLLRHADRNSMRFSVESRVPFLTTELAEFLFSLPEEYLISQKGETKHVFRAAMRGIVPDPVLDRRDKIGFATPEQDWLVALASQARHWLLESNTVLMINKQEMLKKFDSIMNGDEKFSWQVWRMINFVRWHEGVFSKYA